MSIIIFILSTSILLALLILHSYLTRGVRITVNFFLFAFMMMFNKEVVGTVLYNIPKHYQFLIKDTPAIIGQLTTAIGWMITFYLSWCFSELILLRFNNFKKRLFTTLAFSMIVVMSICFCLENFGVSEDLWHWSFYSPTLEPFLVNCEINAIRGWMHMSFMFLLPFLLIECSKYKLTNWKGIFFFIPLVYFWVAPFIGLKNFSIMMDFAIINIMFFSFFTRLQIEFGTIRQVNSSLKPLKYINQIPFIVLVLMLSFVAVREVFFLKQPFLLITTIPLLVILLLSIKKIPLFCVSILTLVMFIIFKEKATLSLIPIIFALMLWVFDKVKILELIKISCQ